MADGMNWGILLERQAERRANRLALIFEGKKFTYGEINRLVKQTANYLTRHGLSKGNRVCLYLPNCWEHVVAHFGVQRIGAVVVPLNPMLKAYEIKYMLKDSCACALITTPDLYRNVKEVREATHLKKVIVLSPGAEEELCFDEIQKESATLEQEVQFDEKEDLAIIQYTSGTTGTPKGAMISYHNVFSISRCYTNLHDYDDTDVQLIALPLFHSFGLFSMYYSVYSGGLIVLVRRFDAEEVLKLIDQFRVTRMNCVPPMLLSFLDVFQAERFSLKSLRQCLCGAAVMPVELMRRIREILGVEVVDGYGCTECYSFIMTPYKGLYKHGSIGIPVPIQEVRLVDDHDRDVPVGTVGEIISRGPLVMKGYLNKPEETAEVMRNGWFHTGDLARKDKDGHYYIVGRKKDVIISSGFNIYPKEVEDLLHNHPKVLDAAVIGVPHEYKGETVKAYIVLKEGVVATPEEIIEYCRKTVAVYKAPKIVEFRKELPRNHSGKILKRLLREENQKIYGS